MKYLYILLSSLSISAYANDPLLWEGSAGIRYTTSEMNDGLKSGNPASGRSTSQLNTKALEYRAAMRVQGRVEDLDWSVGFRTRNGANSDFVSSQQNTDFPIGIETGWVRYADNFLGGNWDVTLGRQRGAFIYESFAENLFAEVLRFDGLGWNWNKGFFRLALGQYSLGAINNSTKSGSRYTATPHSKSQGTGSSLAYLLTAQPSVNIPITDRINTMLAVGFYHWSHTNGFFTNTIHGGIASQSAGASVGTVAVDNPRHIQVYNRWSLPFEIEIFGEWVKNIKKVRYPTSSVRTDEQSWATGIHYGTLERVRGVTASYAYVKKGLGSVPGDYGSTEVLPDNKGHVLALTYVLSRRLQLVGSAFFLQEMSRKTATGAAVATSQNHETTTWRIASNFGF